MRDLIQGRLAVAAVLGGAAVLAGANPASAAIIILQANLDRAQERPVPVVPPGEALPPSGVAIMVYDTVTNTFDMQVSANGITENPALGGIFQVLRDSHIHVAPPGDPGPVIVPFGGPPAWTEPLAGFITMTRNDDPFPQEHEAALLSNNTYFNIHSEENRPGEIRGQLIVVPEPASLGLLGLGGLALLARRRRG